MPVEEIRAELAHIRQQLADVRTEVHLCRREITRYKGFIGGVVWTFSALVAGIALVWNWLYERV